MEANCCTEMCHDVFGCAECDYKSGTETEIMNHNEIRSGTDDGVNTVIDPTEHVLVNIKSECDSIEESDIKSECDSIEESDAFGVSTTMHITKNNYIKNASDKITDHEIIKRKLDPIYVKRLDLKDKPLRLENKTPVRRKATKIPGVVLEIDNGKYMLVKKAPGRRKATEIPGDVVEIDNTGKYIPDGWQRKVYRVTEGTKEGYYRAIYISPTGDILTCRSQASNYIKTLMNHDIRTPVDIEQMDFTTASQIKNIKVHKAYKVEIEVDNTDVYIPDGWERKAFEYLNGSMIKRLAYISPFNKEIFSYIEMGRYLKQLKRKGHSLSVDIERLNFSRKSLKLEKKEPNIPGEDIEIDNTGKYIPDGWQRIVFRGTDGTNQGRHKAIYISPTGNRLHNKSHISQHIKYLEKQGIISPVDIEQMDFSISSHNLPREIPSNQTNNKVEIEVDNTNVYIPEGWERKAFKLVDDVTKVSSRVFYISPYNRHVGSKAGMITYLAGLEKKGCSLSVEIQSLNFSKKHIV